MLANQIFDEKCATEKLRDEAGYKRAVTCKVGVMEDIGIEDTRKTILEAAQKHVARVLEAQDL